MKLAASNGVCETSGDTQEQDFGIGDPWLMLEYMTNSVYSDKHGVIVQEIASNSRDAHREIGQTRRIQIKLPTRMDSTIAFRDFGPGMDPDRIAKVFTKYGNSTKRGSNEQTGGFGIGGKTPWCYTDVFTIRTIANENGKLVLREYSAVKGENRKLKCVQMGKEVVINVNDPTVPADDKMTGTTISFDTKKDDWETFTQKIVRVCKWWKEEEKPEILNGKISYPNFGDRMCEGTNWILLGNGDSHDKYGNNNPHAVIDGIPYPLNASSLDIDYNHDLRPMMDGRLVLFFNVGDLSLALSREQLQYDTATKAILMKRLEEAYEALKKQVDNKLVGCKTLWEATNYYKEMQQSFKISQFVKKPKWKGFDITIDQFSYSSMAANIRNYKLEGGRVKSKKADTLHVNNKTMWVINDTKERSILRLYTLFNSNSNISTLTVIEPNEANVKEWAEFKVALRIDEFNPVKLSTVEKFKRPKSEKGDIDGYDGPRRAVKAYLFSEVSDASPRKMWDQKEIDMDDGEGVYVTLERGNVMDYNHHLVYKTMEVLGGVPLYGIPQRFVQHLGPGYTKLKDYIRERIQELAEKTNLEDIARYLLIKDLGMSSVLGSYEGRDIMDSDLALLIEDQTSPLVHWISRSKDLNATPNHFMQQYNLLVRLNEYLGQDVKLPDVTDDLVDIVKECKERYPLLMVMCEGTTFHKMFADIKNDLLLYINNKNMELTNKAVAV